MEKLRQVEKLRYYLVGREFTLVTDHASLRWMVNAKNSNARVTRWFLALQVFRFQVTPGRLPGVDSGEPEAWANGGGTTQPRP